MLFLQLEGSVVSRTERFGTNLWKTCVYVPRYNYAHTWGGASMPATHCKSEAAGLDDIAATPANNDGPLGSPRHPNVLDRNSHIHSLARYIFIYDLPGCR